VPPYWRGGIEDARDLFAGAYAHRCFQMAEEGARRGRVVQRLDARFQRDGFEERPLQLGCDVGRGLVMLMKTIFPPTSVMGPLAEQGAAIVGLRPKTERRFPDAVFVADVEGSAR